MQPRISIATLLLALLGASPAFGQGSDACAMAQGISGTGAFAFDNTSATLDGVPDPLCNAFGTSDIDFDVWFEWTAPATDRFLLETCNLTSVDTKVAAYDGSCTGPILACNDDSCGFQSRISFDAILGQAYLLRIGTFPGAAGGTGTFTITDSVQVLNPANGNYYEVVFEHLSWGAARIAAEATTFMGHQGHLVTLTDNAEDQFVYFTLAGSELGNAWLGAFQNMNSPTYSEPAGGWEWVTGEPFLYTNWTAGEPNNGGGTEAYLGYWPAEQWNDYTFDDGAVAAYVIEYDTGTTIGDNYCLSVVNSSGGAAEISGTGSASVAANDLSLSAEPVPATQNGIFFYGPDQVQQPFGNGFLCIGPGATGIARLDVVNAGPGGVLAHDLDITMPSTQATQITVGSTWNFAAWFRDPAAGGAFFNLSNGLEVTFLP